MTDTNGESTSGVKRHEEDILIPVGSETVAATRYEPLGSSDPLPVLLCYTPYRKDDRSFWSYHPYVTYLASHGYEVVVADLVGTGASSGVKESPFSTDEGAQAVEIVEWLADRDWTNGRVGMFGLSYPGMTAIRAAIHDPEPLEAIVTLYSAYTTYERRGTLSSSLISGGAIGYQATLRWLPMMQLLQAMPPRRAPGDGGRWADVWQERLDYLREEPPWLFQYLDHESPKDDYWTGQDVTVDEVRSISTPHFAVGGFRDTYVHPVSKYVQQMSGPTRLLLGPWRHVIPNEGKETAVDFYAKMRQWFDHFLKDANNGALDGPQVEYWTERHGGREPDQGVWRGGSQWADAAEDDEDVLSFSLSKAGLVRADSFDSGGVERSYEYDHSVGMDSLVREGPAANTNDDDGRSLCFESEPLESAVETTGTGEATIRLTATTQDPLLGIRLVDVSPSGEGTLVSYGHLRLSHRNGHDDPQPLTPGEEYEITLPLHPNSHVFEEGNRIRVAISAGYFPLMLPTSDHGLFTIRSDPDSPSTIRFPGTVHHGGVAFDDTIEVPRPESTGEQPPSRDTELVTAREHEADTATFEKHQRRGESLPHADMTLEFDERATVQASDPTSAVFSVDDEFVVEYDTEEIRVEVSSRVSRDATEISTQVFRDGQLVFDETWTQ
jgi:putative CocE/NonD family hydrolase